MKTLPRSMKVSFVLFLILATGVVTSSAEPLTVPENFSLAEPPITISAFNVQVFGTKKLGNPKVIEVVKKVILKNDITLIQEIRDSSDTVPNAVLQVVNSTDHPFALAISNRLGRTTSKEQYAFYYRSDKILVQDTYQYPDLHDYFERPPFVVRFISPNTEVQDFAIVAIHTSPSDAVNETSRLADVFDAVRARWGIDDILIAGDFNADCDYVRQDDWPKIVLRTDTSFKWLIQDNLDTTVSGTDCAYDRFVACGSGLKQAVMEASTDVYRFDQDLGLSNDLAKAVSDHYPIVMQIRGKGNASLQNSLESTVSFTIKDKTVVSNINDIRAIYRAPSDADRAGFSSEIIRHESSMYYVIARQENVQNVVTALEKFRATFPILLQESTIDAVRSTIWANTLKVSEIYGLPAAPSVDSRDLEILCRLRKPYTCEVTVIRKINN